VRFTDMCTARRYPHQRIGVLDDGGDAEPSLHVQEMFHVTLAELHAAHEATLPAAMAAPTVV
jgi:phosphoribosylformylglycinamidine synthase